MNVQQQRGKLEEVVRVRCSCDCPFFGKHGTGTAAQVQCDCGRRAVACIACLQAGRLTSCGQCGEANPPCRTRRRRAS